MKNMSANKEGLIGIYIYICVRNKVIIEMVNRVGQ